MEWFKNNFKQAVLIALLTVFLSTIGSLIVFSFTAKETKLDKAASIDYVNEKDHEQMIYINNQDQVITERLNRVQAIQQTKVDQSEFDKVYMKTEENNRLLIEILMKINKLD